MDTSTPAAPSTTARATTAPAVELRGLGKTFGAVTALADVDLTVAQGELVSLLGASGSGKSTLLRLIAGFDTPTSGDIHLGGRLVSSLSPAQRDIGMVFQNYALFPHLSVRRNVEYGLKMRGWTRARRAERVGEMLERMRLADYGNRLPRELSGGQQQRVAIARALAFSPRLLLMDEPLGALDKALKENLLEEIRRVHREFGTTILYVTHDREEALVLSDRIALMDAARLQVCAPVQSLYLNPPTAFAARFTSGATILPLDGSTLQIADRDASTITIAFAAGHLRLPCAASAMDLALAVRPTGWRLAAETTGMVSGTVVESVFLGETTRLRVDLPQFGTAASCTLPLGSAEHLAAGDVVQLDLDPAAVNVVAA
jgi:putative spermidine/putrescine transport system ATP-binding protein